MAIFKDDHLEELWIGPDVNRDAIQVLVDKYRPQAAIVSTVRGSGDGVSTSVGPDLPGVREASGGTGKPGDPKPGDPTNHASRESETALHHPGGKGAGNMPGQPANGPKDSPTNHASRESGNKDRSHGHTPANPELKAGSQEKQNGPPELPPELNFLPQQGLPVLVAGVHLALPIALKYETPETLGTDRLAAALAANVFFPGENTLVISAGTCLTTDFVTDKGEYIGGSIAPGLRMRLRAMHHFTGRLPLIEFSEGGTEPARETSGPDESVSGSPGQAKELNKSVTGSPGSASEPNKAVTELPGQSTKNSMLAGVTTGMVAEIDGLIEIWRKKISFFNVILSGGDANFFDKNLKNRIFAVDNIVLHGLNLMLKHNVQHL